MLFQTPIDIANRACQHLGQGFLNTFSDGTRQANELNFCYDKLRTAELQKSPWRFATRRALIYPFTATTKRFIPVAWAISTAYLVGQIVMDSFGTYWICIFSHTSSGSSGLGTNAPGFSIVGNPAYWQEYFGPLVMDLWSSSVTYNAGDLVYTGTNPYNVFISLINANTNNSTTGADWQNISGTGVNTTLIPVNFIIPAGPSFASNRNIFPLPNGFLRFTSPDGKNTNGPNLVASGGMRFVDWQPESGYFVSTATTPTLIRFIADVSDVLSMTPLFCETLGASCAKEVCEPLTQSQEKYARVAASYAELFDKAEVVNYLELGSTEVQDGAMNDDTQNSRYPTPAPQAQRAPQR